MNIPKQKSAEKQQGATQQPAVKVLTQPKPKPGPPTPELCLCVQDSDSVQKLRHVFVRHRIYSMFADVFGFLWLCVCV